MQSSVLLCISTLLDGANHYSKMIALRDEKGQPVFESIAITLVCGIHTLRTLTRLFYIPLTHTQNVTVHRRLPQDGTSGAMQAQDV